MLSLGYPENSQVRHLGSEMIVKQDRCTGEGSKHDLSNQQCGKTLSKARGPQMTLWGWHKAVRPLDTGDLTSNPSSLLFCHLGKFPLCSEPVFLAGKWVTSSCEY